MKFCSVLQIWVTAQASFRVAALTLFSTDYIAPNLIQDVVLAAEVPGLWVPLLYFTLVILSVAAVEQSRGALSAECDVVGSGSLIVLDIRSFIFDELLRQMRLP